MQPATNGRRTHIIATIGPASRAPATLEALVHAGMDIARINFSHATHEEAAAVVATLRSVSPSVAILGDLQGPKRRIGYLSEPLPLKRGQHLLLTGKAGSGSADSVLADITDLGAVVPGVHIAVGDGAIELEVVTADTTGIHTTVVNDGLLTSRAGIYVPDANPTRQPITDQDCADLAFAVSLGMEWIALSFVGEAEDVNEARLMLDAAGAGSTRLMAKVERRSALVRLEDIATASDGLMVARGDLGVAVGVEQVPIWQHRIISAGIRADRPVVVATEMLESMRTAPRPTRAEASDIAHAVWEGASGLLLSAETAVGEHPAAVVATMDRIIRAAETDTDTDSTDRTLARKPTPL